MILSLGLVGCAGSSPQEEDSVDTCGVEAEPSENNNDALTDDDETETPIVENTASDDVTLIEIEEVFTVDDEENLIEYQIHLSDLSLRLSP